MGMVLEKLGFYENPPPVKYNLEDFDHLDSEYRICNSYNNIPSYESNLTQNLTTKLAFIKFFADDISEENLYDYPLPSYSKEFFMLCKNSDLLTLDNKTYENRFLKCIKTAYPFLNNLQTKNRLPLKFHSHKEYCYYWTPFLYLNSASQIQSNIQNGTTDQYQALFIGYKLIDSDYRIIIDYWIPDLDFDEVEEDNPNYVKNLNLSLVYLSDSSLPSSYDNISNTFHRGFLSLCYKNSPLFSKKKYIKCKRINLDNLSHVLLKPSTTYKGFYRKVRAWLHVPKEQKYSDFCRLMIGKKLYLTVLESLSQANKQLETMQTMNTNYMFNKYILSPSSNDFNISPNTYSEDCELNSEQFQAVQSSDDLFRNNRPGMLLIQGPPGTGKSHTIVSIIRKYFNTNIKKKQESSILICAPSNIAIDVIGKRLIDQGFKKHLLRLGIMKKTSPDLKSIHIKNFKSINNVKKNEKKSDLFNSLSIVLSTLNSAQPIYRGSRNFDLIIIDEAAQCSETELLLSFVYFPKTIILVGDHLQLLPTVKSRHADSVGYSRSLFERLRILAGNNIIMLTKQYRMKSEICMLSSKLFYKNLISSAKDNGYNPLIRLSPLTFFDILDSKEIVSRNSTSVYNMFEKVFIIRILETILADIEFQRDNYKNNIHLQSHYESTSSSHLTKIRVGIICFYKEQKKIIEQGIFKRFKNNDLIDIKTVDSFQGQERDIIIISCTRANKRRNIGFTCSKNRINVAITRAKSALIFVCNENTFQQNTTWAMIFNHLRNEKVFHSVSSNIEDDTLKKILF